MWPWGHAAVGYLLYSALVRARGRRPSGQAALAVLVGSQVPDLVDKPLAWTVGVLPTGRSLAHSWLVAVPLLAVLWWRRPAWRRPLAALGVGWLSHGLADAVGPLLAGEVAYARFLLWPLRTTPPYDTDPSFVAHALALDLDPLFLVQVPLVAAALYVWHRDGRPGSDVRALLDRARRGDR